MDIQSERIISAAREMLKSCGYFVDNLWHADDINFLCGQLGYPPVDLAEARAVFEIANEQFDGEYGICWPQLEKALVCYMERREMLQEMCGEDAIGGMELRIDR